MKPILLAFLFITFIITPMNLQSQNGHHPSHRTENGFRNPYTKPIKKGMFAFLKMKYVGNERFPVPDPNNNPIPKNSPDLDLIRRPDAELQATWIGHATVLVQCRGVNFLTDPMFSDRASPVGWLGPKRYNPPALTLDQLPKIDFVLLSHNHYDSLDLPTVKKLADNTVWFVPLKIKDALVKAGVSETRIFEFDWWDTRQSGHAAVTALPAQHWSSRTPWDRNETLWASWLVNVGGIKIWFAGDTGYNDVQFKEIGDKMGPIDLALIPIGAYSPRWFMKNSHVNPEEAVRIHQDVRARRSLAIHWGTFVLTSEPVDEPPKRLKRALTEANLPLESFQALPIGGQMIFELKNWSQ